MSLRLSRPRAVSEFRQSLNDLSPSLNDLMQFDVVVRVYPTGHVTREHATAPYFELNSGKLSATDEGWYLLTGYTSQYGYRGCDLHSSEYIGEGLERDILAAPGRYVALVSHYCLDEELEEGEISCSCDQWAVAYCPDEVM